MLQDQRRLLPSKRTVLTYFSNITVYKAIRQLQKVPYMYLGYFIILEPGDYYIKSGLFDKKEKTFYVVII